MFAYCGNNPVFREDNSGTIWGAILIGAGVNLVTSYFAAKMTNQQFTLMDALVAVAAGGFGAVLPGVGGLISGAYTGYMAYKNGATTKQAVLCGAVAFSCTAFSMGGISDLVDEGAKLTGKLAAKTFVNTTFTTAYNGISAATYGGIVKKSQKSKSASSPSSKNVTVQATTANYNAFPWMSSLYTGR